MLPLYQETKPAQGDRYNNIVLPIFVKFFLYQPTHFWLLTLAFYHRVNKLLSNLVK